MSDFTSQSAVDSLSAKLEQQVQAIGFHRFGIVAIAPEPTPQEHTMQTRLRQWVDRGYQADMGWMVNPKRQNIRRVMPEVRSIICVALNYYTPHQRPDGAEYGKIARYGWGRDYHRVMHKKLKQLSLWLQTQSDGEPILTRYYADTGPVQDKFWAQEAGLGWVAKNGNVITRDYGSWIFLGEILTTAALVAAVLTPAPPMPFEPPVLSMPTAVLLTTPSKTVVNSSPNM